MQNTNGARESEASFETEDFYRKITELNNPNDFVLQISLVHRKTPQEIHRNTVAILRFQIN